MELERIAREIELAITDVPGTRSAFADRVLGGKYLDLVPDRTALARHNIDMGTFQTVVQTALGGMQLAQSVEGRERYNVMLRYERKFRESARDLKDILIPAPGGAHIPLGDLASIQYVEGPVSYTHLTLPTILLV